MAPELAAIFFLRSVDISDFRQYQVIDDLIDGIQLQLVVKSQNAFLLHHLSPMTPGALIVLNLASESSLAIMATAATVGKACSSMLTELRLGDFHRSLAQHFVAFIASISQLG